MTTGYIIDIDKPNLFHQLAQSLQKQQYLKKRNLEDFLHAKEVKCSKTRPLKSGCILLISHDA